MALLALAGLERPPGEMFNVATGADVSIGAIVEMVGAELGRELAGGQSEERMRPGAAR